MVSYGIAKARAKANRTDWNERTEFTKAVITWVDDEYEYDLEIENEDRMYDEEFTEWVEKNAESLAKADAEENETIFEGFDRIANHSLGNKAVWLVPKKYSTQNSPAMFVQYIFSL